jgi:hypothetical protein
MQKSLFVLIMMRVVDHISHQGMRLLRCESFMVRVGGLMNV